MKYLFKLDLHAGGSSCAWYPTTETSLEKVIKHNIKIYNARLRDLNELNTSWWERTAEEYSECLPPDFIKYCSKRLPYPVNEVDEKNPTIF